MQFLGYVTQQYTAKRDVDGKPRAVRAFDQIIKKVPNAIKDQIIEKLQPTAATSINYIIGSIPTLHSLIPLSQTSRRPIFGLRAIDGVVGAHFAKVSEYQLTIDGIVDRMIENLEALA